MSTETSMDVAHGSGEGQENLTVGTTSVKTAAPIGARTAVIYTTVECFVVAGEDPTATVAAGTPIPAGALVRLGKIEGDEKLAFITASGSGTVYVRPGA